MLIRCSGSGNNFNYEDFYGAGCFVDRFASAIFEQARTLGLLARQPRVVPISSAEFPTPAVRPAWSLLDNSGFRRHFDCALPDWQQGLREVMHQLATSGH